MQTAAMDISTSTGVIKDPSDPEELSVPESGSSIDSSSLDTDSESGVQIACDLIESLTQQRDHWLFEVFTCAFNHKEEEVASVHAYLIKKENIQAHESKKKSLRKALRDEDPMLNVMFELPQIFHPHGHVNPEFLPVFGHCIGVDDTQAPEMSSKSLEKPQERAWILLIRDVMVDAKYRQLSIGGNMIRKTLQRVLTECSMASRPLIVAVQPKRTDEFSDEQWSEINEMIYNCRVNEVFWENIGFKRLKSRYSGFTSPWFLWGSAFRLPLKKKITIPDDLENRNTRTATPPPRPHSPRYISRPTPYDCYPVVQGKKIIYFIHASTNKLPAVRPTSPRDDAASDDHDGDDVQWVDNPDDPSITQRDAQHIRDLILAFEIAGKKCRVRPIKEPVQIPVAQSTSVQSNCPFKAPPGVEAPRSLNLIHPPHPSPSCSAPSQPSAALEQSPVQGSRRSFRTKVSSALPGSHFLVTYVLSNTLKLIYHAD